MLRHAALVARSGRGLNSGHCSSLPHPRSRRFGTPSTEIDVRIARSQPSGRDRETPRRLVWFAHDKTYAAYLACAATPFLLFAPLQSIRCREVAGDRAVRRLAHTQKTGAQVGQAVTNCSIRPSPKHGRDLPGCALYFLQPTGADNSSVCGISCSDKCGSALLLLRFSGIEDGPVQHRLHAKGRDGVPDRGAR
jgi:hypothetical protein